MTSSQSDLSHDIGGAAGRNTLMGGQSTARASLDALSEAVLVVGGNGRIELANRAATDLLEPESGIVGRDFASLVALHGDSALSIITQALTFALMLAFFRNDMGFGGNNGLTDFKDVLGFDLQAKGTRNALFVLSAFFLLGSYYVCPLLLLQS